jgi:hypothetical protein
LQLQLHTAGPRSLVSYCTASVQQHQCATASKAVAADDVGTLFLALQSVVLECL